MKKAYQAAPLLFVRAFASMVIIGILLFVCGCSAPTLPTIPKPVVSNHSDIFSAAVFYYDYSDAYIASVRSELNRSLVILGIPYSEYDAASSQSTQNNQIETAIAGGAKLLIVNIVNSGSSDTSDAICLKAEKAGIPVIFFNRPIEADGDEGIILDYYHSVAFVGTDPAEAGHLQGEMIGEYLCEHFDEIDINGDGQISYAMFKGEAKNAEAIYRTKYAVVDADLILKNHDHPPLYYFNPDTVDHFQLDLTGKWSLTSAQDYMMTNLSRFNEDSGNMIELVIANNDNMAEGAIRALQALGYNLPEERGSRIIPVFGVDATASARQLIANGMMTGTVLQDSQGMAGVVAHLARNVSIGEDLLADTEKFRHDEEHDLKNKLYIPYGIYDPNENKAASMPETED